MTWNFDFDDVPLQIADIMLTTLSLLGSSALIIYCSRQRNRTRGCRINLICLGIADFFFSFSNLLSFAQKPNSLVDHLCFFEATIRLWSWHLSLIFATSIAVMSYLQVSSWGLLDSEQAFKIITCTSLATIFLLNCMAFIPEKTGIGYFNSQIMCLIYYDQRDPRVGLMKKLLVATFYDGIFFAICLAVTIISHIANFRTIRNSKLSDKINPSKLLLYPAVMIISFVPYIINDYYQAFDPSSPKLLLILHISLNHSTGWLNALVYGILRRTSDRLSEVASAVDPTPIPSPRGHDDSLTIHLVESRGDIYTG